MRIEELPEQLQNIAHRIARYKPRLCYCSEIPHVRSGFAVAWWSMDGQLALGDLRIDVSTRDVQAIFEAVAMPIVDLTNVEGLRLL